MSEGKSESKAGRLDLEPELVNEFGRYTPAPTFRRISLEEDGVPEARTERDALLAMDKASLVDEVLSNRARVQMWERAASELVSGLALAPDANAVYSRLLRALLTQALAGVSAIDELRHVECSMPSLAAERPSISLLQWSSLAYSEWHITWSPASWWVSVSCVGYRWGLSFNVLTSCSSIFVRGVLRCAFSEDLTSLRVSFTREPTLHMSVESKVGWGAVPVPVQEQIEGIVRSEIHKFVMENLVGNESLVVVLRRKAKELVSDEDVQEAKEAAKRANSVQLRL